MGGGDDGDGGGGVDLISGLSDDLLVRILELLPDARDVLRTDALSRRWRGLWTGVAALRFDSDRWPGFYGEAGAAEQYLAFVDDVLTRQAKATTTTRCRGGVKHLEISLDTSQSDLITEEIVSPSFKPAKGWFKAAQGWIRYAAQHEVTSLVLRLNLLWFEDAEDFRLKPYVPEGDDENVDYDHEDYDENVDYDEEYDENMDYNDEDYDENVDYDEEYDENVDYDDEDYDENVDYDEEYDENVDYDDEDYDENVDYDEEYDENVDYDDEDYDENVDFDYEDYGIPVMALDDLAASPAKLETMHLTLSGAKLCLPFSSSSTVVFSALRDVSLKDIVVAGHLLSRLVSPPCCPCLRKLHLDDLHLCTIEEQMEELLLEGDTLLELSLRQIRNMQSLELRTPSLQVLGVENCTCLEVFTVSAPMLEDLMFEAHNPLRIVDVEDHLSSVGTLKIHLYSHGNRDGEDSKDASIQLLQCCRLTKCLEVSLEVLEIIFQKGDTIKGQIPSLPHVTSLTVQVTMREPHSFGASIASLLAQCNNIRYLSLKFDYMYIKKEHYLCDNSCQWKSHEFFLAHLQEAEFEWLIGTDCELQFIQSILKKKTGLQKAAISFDPYWMKDNKEAFKLVPPLDGGSWTTYNADLSYKWRRHCV